MSCYRCGGRQLYFGCWTWLRDRNGGWLMGRSGSWFWYTTPGYCGRNYSTPTINLTREKKKGIHAWYIRNSYSYGRGKFDKNPFTRTNRDTRIRRICIPKY